MGIPFHLEAVLGRLARDIAQMIVAVIARCLGFLSCAIGCLGSLLCERLYKHIGFFKPKNLPRLRLAPIIQWLCRDGLRPEL